MIKTDTAPTDALIQRLAQDAGSVRRPPPPLARAILWFVVTLAFIAVMAPWDGLRPDLAVVAGQPLFVAEWVASLLTAASACLAAFHLCLPDRDHRWVYVPVPALLLWIGAALLGLGRDWMICGPDGFAMATSWACVRFILKVSVPSGLLMLWLLRTAGPIRPTVTTLHATLAVAAAASAAQSLFHGLTTSIMVIVWHGGTIAAFLLLARLIGPLLMRAMLALGSYSRARA